MESAYGFRSSGTRIFDRVTQLLPMDFLRLFFCAIFCLKLQKSLQVAGNANGLNRTSMDPEELKGLFDVMEAIIDDPSWRSNHPHPCTDNPWPGVGCEANSDNIFHITELRIGLEYTGPCRNDSRLSPAILKLHFLKTLFIFNCFRISSTTILPDLVQLSPSLEELVFKFNSALAGSIPAELSGLTRLRILSLSQNNLRGPVPPELGKLPLLKHMDLSYNKLEASIPSDFGGLISLSILDLSQNRMQGKIPKSIGNLSLLEKIDLSYNNFSGEIPPEIGNLKNLSFLALSRNRFTGPLPDTFSSLKNLEYLKLEDNPMNSKLPDFLGSLPQLTELSLSSAGIEGSIPESLCRLRYLSALALDDNRLEGSIPCGMGGFGGLFQLNLSGNLLSGEVPFSEQFVKRLGNKLDLRGNKDLCTGKRLYGVFPAGKIQRCSEDSSEEFPHLNVPGEERGVYGSFSGIVLVQGFSKFVWVVCTLILLQIQMPVG